MSSIYSPHIHLNRLLWSSFLKKGLYVLDATCGNGHDTLFLAQHVLTDHSGFILSVDIQEIALKNTLALIKKSLPPQLWERVILEKKCHSLIKTKQKFDLVVYNLGYLPGANKQFTTKSSTTLKSLKLTMQNLNEGGAISITCYPGHPEGKLEEQALLSFLDKLDSKIWSVSYHSWLNRPASPSIIWLRSHPNAYSG